MDEYRRSTKKHLGQHFLADTTYIQAILSAIAPDTNQSFLEIGPGSGALTEGLLQSGVHLAAVELDQDCVQYLRTRYGHNENFRVFPADILQFSFAELAPSMPLRVVGNLPYNISTPILLKLIELKQGMQDGYFMLQQEVAQRCYAKAGQKSYGRLSVMLALYFEVEPVLFVPNTAFNPPPKVQSEVILMKPKSITHDVDEKTFSWVVHLSFVQRRKMLRKIFQKHLTTQDWSYLDLDSTLRPEVLTLEHFLSITRLFMQRSKEGK